MYALFPFFQKSFVDDDLKKAYLKCCKYVSTNIIHKNKADRYVWNMQKVSDIVIQLTVYFLIDATETKNNACKACKEFHCSFYINEQYNCNSCNLEAFFEQLKQRGKIGTAYHKQTLK